MAQAIEFKAPPTARVSSHKRLATSIAVALACAGGVFAAYHYSTVSGQSRVPVAPVREGEFITSVHSRGEIRSANSIVISAPQIPEPRIVKLAVSGTLVHAGDVVAEFDTAQEEQLLLEKTHGVHAADSEIVQTKAEQRMTDEMDGMHLMQSQYNVQRAQLEASKAEVLSKVEGDKNRIDAALSEGDLTQVKDTIQAHVTAEAADLDRLREKKSKVERDAERTKGYLSSMVLRAPIDGVINILPNFRSSGSYGSTPPPFKAGDRAWTGAAIAEIPDLKNMRIELKLDEVERGKVRLGQKLNVRVDALPDKQFVAELNWISPVANVIWRGMGLTDKLFPAYATLKKLDPRLRPGMSGSVDIVVESRPKSILIPARASFLHDGQAAVYVQRGPDFVLRAIQPGKRNDTDMIVVRGLRPGEVVALEDPAEARRERPQ